MPEMCRQMEECDLMTRKKKTDRSVNIFNNFVLYANTLKNKCSIDKLTFYFHGMQMLCLSCVMVMHFFITFKQLLKTYRRITRIYFVH